MGSYVDRYGHLEESDWHQLWCDDNYKVGSRGMDVTCLLEIEWMYHIHPKRDCFTCRYISNLIHNLHCKNGSNPTTNKVFLHFWFEAILFVTHYITMKNCWIHFCISLNKRSGPQKILVLPFQQDYDDNISIESLEYAILWRNAYTQKL